jgi:hypothetical protein
MPPSSSFLPRDPRAGRTRAFAARLGVASVAVLLVSLVGVPAASAIAPDAPPQPTVVAGNEQVAVTFDEFPPEIGVTGYGATCVSSDGGLTGSASDIASPIVVGSLSNGKSYTCTVTATNGDGTSPPSPASDAVVPSTVPDAPDKPGVVGGNAQVTVSFGAPFDGGRAITGYAAACLSSNGGANGLVHGPASPIVVDGLTNGKTYTCLVRATNVNGPSAQSPASVPVIPSTVPTAPAKPTVGIGNGKLTVSFGAPPNGGSDITGYIAACSSSDGGVPGSNSAVDSPIAVGGLSNGKTYTCTVTATNANGPSDPSPASVPATPSTVPTAPGKPTAGVGNARLTVFFVPPFDGGRDITGYAAACVSSNGGASGSNTGAGSPIQVAGLTNGKSYTCTVTASNGNGDSAPSVPSAPAVPNRVPDAPARPTAVAGNGSVAVSFVAPFDGGSDITRFDARCVSSNGGGAGSATGSGSPIAVVGLANGKSYTCTVSATNANGTGVPSLPSAAVVPSTVPSAPGKPSVTAGNGQVTVSFGAPGSGGSAITSYTSACASTNGGRSAAATGPRSPLTVTGLTNDKTYRCDVFARNKNGPGHRSVASGLVVPVDPVSIRSRTVHGFRLFAGDGGVFTFGAATNYGSAAGIAQHLVVGMASTLSNRGYWLVATDGGIFSFGDARFFGSTGAMRLNQPVVGMAPTPSGHGYWLVASDGGNFSFGDARFHGSAANLARSRIAGMATTASGNGYWVAAEDGSVYPFGDAPRLGGAPASALRLPVRGIASTADGKGYWLAAGDGGLFAFGDAPFIGWPGPLVLAQTIRGVSR